MSKKISELRKEIDKLDFELLQLLDKRMEYAICIGKEKILQKSNIYCPKREQQILQRLKKKSLRYLNHEIIDSIYREIFAFSRKMEKVEKVAFFSFIGDLAYEVAIKKFGFVSEYLMMQDLASLFRAVQLGEVKYGVIPLENDNGIVKESFELLLKNKAKIIAETSLSLQYSFASNEERIQDIKKIYLEKIAVDQCGDFLKSYCLNEDKWVFVDSSITAARMFAKKRHVAIICSNTIAKLHNIPIIFENIQGKNNWIRFVIIGDSFSQKTNKNKTSLIATIRNKGRLDALLDLLKDIKKHGIVLIKIEEKKINSISYFYLEFEGYFDDKNLQEFFKKNSRELKLLGSYPREL